MLTRRNLLKGAAVAAGAAAGLKPYRAPMLECIGFEMPDACLGHGLADDALAAVNISVPPSL